MDRVKDREPAPEAEIHDITGPRISERSSVLKEAWRYWSSLRRGDSLPLRTALEPSAMSSILGHSMILNRVRPGTVRVRLGGRVPNDLMGMETRGLPIRAFFDLMQRGHAVELIERVFTQRVTLELDLTSEGQDGTLAARMVVLPLADADGGVTKALAVLVPDRAISEGPRRFRIARENVAPTIGLAPVEHRAFVQPEPRMQEAAEDTSPYAIGTGQATEVPWLRVVK